MDTGILKDLIQAFGPTSTIMLIVVVYLIREKRNGKNGNPGNPGIGITKDQMSELRDEVHELHGWHDTDDPETGQKRWLLMPNILTELKGIKRAIEENTLTIAESHKRLRKSIEEQTGAVVKNTATLELLENKIVKFVT